MNPSQSLAELLKKTHSELDDWPHKKAELAQEAEGIAADFTRRATQCYQLGFEPPEDFQAELARLMERLDSA